MEREPILAVGAVVEDGAGRLLLVRRGREPAAGLWSIPGGKVEPGESLEEAVRREVLEETGLDVVVGPAVGTVQRPTGAGGVFVIHDYRVRLTDDADPGAAVPGDDAADLGWYSPAELRALDTVPGLVEQLEEWGVVPPG